MFAFSAGRRPVKVMRSAPGFVAVASAALSAAGCAASGNTYYSSSAAPAYVAQGPAVPMEQDGLPSQAAPSARIRQMPDDPTQPYSRNYGGPNPAGTLSASPSVKASNEVAPRQPIPNDLPPAFRRQLAAAVDAAG